MHCGRRGFGRPRPLPRGIYGVWVRGGPLFGPAVEISTKEELLDNLNAKSAVLTADIDFDFSEMTHPINIQEFDGQGHTIKNLDITSVYMDSLFGETALKISNLTVENVTVTRRAMGVAVILGKAKLENRPEITGVHVKNCTVNALEHYNENSRLYDYGYVGAIYGGGNKEKALNQYEPTIRNCSVENTTINFGIDSPVTKHDFFADVHVGGVAGSCSSIEGCTVKDCTLTVKSNSMYCEPFVGGIVGRCDGSIKNCAVTGTDLDVSALWSEKASSVGIVSYYFVSKASAGGIAGRIDSSETTEHCLVEDCDIEIGCTGNVRGGGIAGSTSSGVTLSQCLVSSLELTSDSCNDNPDEVYRYVGGLAGVSSGKIASCLVASANVVDVLNEDFDDSKPKRECVGATFLAGGSAQISKCAVYDCTSDGYLFSYFGSSGSTFTDCYLQKESQAGGDIKALPDEADWLGPTLSNRLGLDSHWKCEDGKLPTLTVSAE